MDEELISQLKKGKESAIRRLWNGYTNVLARFARRTLRNVPREDYDEEDLLLSAFRSAINFVRDKKYRCLTTQQDFEQILYYFLRCKASARIRHIMAQKRHGGRTGTLRQSHGSESEEDLLETIPSSEPTPQQICEYEEVLEQLLDPLSPRQRDVVVLWSDGFTVGEIATSLAVSARTVDRDLQLIRRRLERLQD